MRYLFIAIMLAAMTGALVQAGGEAFSVHPERQNSAYDVPFYTGTIHPSPQEAEYSRKFLPLSRVGVVLGDGIGEDDARLALLLERIVRHGGSPAIVPTVDGEFGSFICIGEGKESRALCEDTAPDRPEGYVIRVVKKRRKPVVVLKAHDDLGLLWAITSLNQLITTRKGQPVMRRASVTDYPDAPGKRGYTAGGEHGQGRLPIRYIRKGYVEPAAEGPPASAWFAVNCLRANTVFYRQPRSTGDWRKSIRDPLQFNTWVQRIERIGRYLNPLGIEWVDSILPLSSVRTEDQVRSGSDEDFELILKAARTLGKAGGHFCLLYDDFRFPMHPDDVKQFGTAREADIFFLNKLYAAIRAEYPDFKIYVCPPFYWGPLSDSSGTYGESRDEYLAACGKRLPEGIELYWTGPRVKSRQETPEDLKWITDLIRRKPVFWQNTAGVGHGGQYFEYLTDPFTVWPKWYYDGFFDAITLMTHNSSTYAMNMTLMDFMWNRKAYDAERSIVEVGNKLVGPDVYPKVLEAYRALESLDIYGWSATAYAARHLEEFKKGVAELDRLTQEVLAVRGAAVETWTGLSKYNSWRQKYLKRMLANPKLKELTEVDDRVREAAVKETGADSEKDAVLTPNDFRLERPPRYYKWKNTDRRFVAWINGQQSGMHTMTATFRLKAPPTSDYEAVICGLDHNTEPPCRIRILANGKQVFEGENPFKEDQWTTHSFRVPGNLLKDNDNRFAIVNVEDSGNISGPPWFMVNYVVVRPVKE